MKVKEKCKPNKANGQVRKLKNENKCDNDGNDKIKKGKDEEVCLESVKCQLR